MSSETNNEVTTNQMDTSNMDKMPSNDDKNIATIMHIGGTVFSFVPALIVWILKKDENQYVEDQAKEALNFQITMVLAYMLAGVLSWILIGLIFFPIIWVLNIVFCIIAAISTSKGETYRYPFALRLIN
ncbi:DUF4870 domain-containing protein [Methylotenera versatilis]|uniref:Transmembrane protein n=1 Tax=Methylotenera versatilis (strain 301) TaxID=666681 RepID=D7DKZ9_METV0|nr:DUF4870 domain-containing protein [Methylotenera versatilis]ADI28610.1 conserved hypothetical protein [Methylotenera versatilis 301]